jgi:hypothetical protein
MEVLLDVVQIPPGGYMRNRLSIIFLVLILMFSVSLSAEAVKPSVFDFDVMNYYKISDLVGQNFAAYTPGVRMQVNITNWFGLSAEVICPLPADTAVGPYRFTLATDLVLRLPLGFFEPFLAMGPAYVLDLTPPGVFDFDDTVHFNVRTGFDINFNSWFALGFEAKLPVYGVEEFFLNLADVDGAWFVENTYVGIGLKVKL